MKFADVNNIILPLFINTATPIEKERDTIAAQALNLVQNYCREMPMAKRPESSYLCRLQLESDCLDGGSDRACDLLARVKDLEKDARTRQIVAREKSRDSTFWCRTVPKEDKHICIVPKPVELPRAPGNVVEKIKIRAGSFNMGGDLSWSAKYSIGIQEKMRSLLDLGDKIRQSDLPVSCSQDSQCSVQGIGDKGCGGYVSSVYYSGNAPVISDIRQFNKLDHELNSLLQFGSTCDYHMLYEPVCRNSVCVPGDKPIASKKEF